MFISRKTIFAISVMIDIAQNANDRLVSAKELADRHGVMPRFFEIMLKNLANAGLIRGQRGPRGGYQLARDTGTINVSDIATAVHPDRDEEEKELLGATSPSLAPYLRNTNMFILRKLSECSLAELMRRQDNKKMSEALAS